jgi:hypothetical protein
MTTEQASSDEQLVWVRRQWNDWRLTQYRLSDITGLRWDNVSGGVKQKAPRVFLHGYVFCDEMVPGELSHSCRHGAAPHHVKVCITKKGNEAVWPQLLKKERLGHVEFAKPRILL